MSAWLIVYRAGEKAVAYRGPANYQMPQRLPSRVISC
jgi:hypothetical protein